MATSEGGQASSAVPWDQRLRSEAQWRVWISHIQSASTAEEVWEYMDPDLSDEKVSKPPVDSRKTFPQASEVKESATDPSDLDEVQYLRYSRMVSLFEKERTFNNSIKKSIARINARILDCVSPEYHHILSDKKTAREKLVRLAQQFKPKGETRHQDLRNAWRYMLHTPIGKTSIERWLTNWSNLYDEAKSAEVPDICYRSTAHPEDRTAIRDFLQAVQPQDSYFSNHWRDKIQLPEVKMSFHEVLSAYRTHRSVQEQSKKGNSSAIAFAATLNGQQVLSNQKNHQQRCVCGSSRHHWKDCYHINASKRPPNWQQYEGSRKRVEDGIKKLSAVEQQEIAKMRSETSSLGKTAQLAITNESDVPIESMAFFSASISPAVCNAAMVFPLKSSWIVDSGANVHICNRRDRFEDLVEERRTVTLGTGGTITLGRGTAKVIIKNPTTGKVLWGILQDVWYAPDFQTNIISVSEIKKNGFFFNSELPAITRDGNAVAICAEQYGLYLLEHYRNGKPALPPPAAFPALKTSAKPPVSVASPQIWHRRLAHMYDRRVETLAGMVDGIEIKGESEDNAQCNPERCEVCQLTRAKRQISRRPAERSHTFGKFGRLHFDLVQLDEAYNGHKWISHLYVEGIRLHMSQSHEKKSGCVDAIIKFIAICRNQLRMPIKVFKSDNEKTLGRAIKEYCEEEGITAEFSVVGTPEQNGFIERAGGIIITTARALILDSGLPKKLWPEAVRAAVYLINRTPTTLQNGQQIIPWVEAMRNQSNQLDQRLNLSNLRLYGCRAYVRRQGIPQKDKMAPRAEIGYLVGYVASNIWRVWFPHLDAVREVRDVVFDENVRFDPKELEKPPTRDILEAMPWSVVEYEEERVITDLEEPTLATSTTEEPEGERRDKQDTSRKTTENGKQQGPLTPSPTASRDSTPTMAPGRSSAVPGAFPEETRRAPIPLPSSNHLEAEGVVRDLNQPEDPDQQLHGDLQASALSPATPDVSESIVPTGYRRRGSLAPRDINSSVSESNIITSKRKRAYFTSVASMEREDDSHDPEDYHEGLLLAFTAGMSSPQAYQRPHRDDLPPEPSNWLEMMRHPHRDAFIEAAALEVKTLEKKGRIKRWIGQLIEAFRFCR
jgi:Integrase core domain.